MVMSTHEIVISYRTARNPRLQIGVLADLNATCKEEIEDVLKEAGVAVPPRVISKHRRFDTEVAMRYYKMGLTDKEIADAMGFKYDTVNHWRNRVGLPPQQRSKK